MGKKRPTQLTPLGNRLLLQPIEETVDRTEGGLWLPPSADERQRYRRWEIIAVGAEVLDETLLPGVEVIARRYGGTPIKFAGLDLMFVSEDDVYAVISEESA